MQKMGSHAITNPLGITIFFVCSASSRSADLVLHDTDLDTDLDLDTE